MEIWKDIPGYEGLYQVSNYGRVKSLERIIIRKNGKLQTIKEKIMKPFLGKDKHLYVCFRKNNYNNHYQIHRLVALVFILNPHCYEVVHHIDYNPQNNMVDNLMWMSREEHTAIHATENNSKTVFQYTLDGELVAVWESASEAAKQLGFQESAISNCCLGKRKTHKGYRWSYVPL